MFTNRLHTKKKDKGKKIEKLIDAGWLEQNNRKPCTASFLLVTIENLKYRHNTLINKDEIAFF
ncbi:MAG: hypothetical protein ACREUM_11630, partial [Nitrosospira sp.]